MDVRARLVSLAIAAYLITTGALAAATDWTTPAERTGFRATPTLEETTRWLRRAERAAPFIRLTTFGTSGAGRAMPHSRRATWR